MQQLISDQIDKFHEDVCYWHLFDDVLDQEVQVDEAQKTNFYSSDEYLLYQKSLLKRELKT